MYYLFVTILIGLSFFFIFYEKNKKRKLLISFPFWFTIMFWFGNCGPIIERALNYDYQYLFFSERYFTSAVMYTTSVYAVVMLSYIYMDVFPMIKRGKTKLIFLIKTKELKIIVWVLLILIITFKIIAVGKSWMFGGEARGVHQFESKSVVDLIFLMLSEFTYIFILVMGAMLNKKGTFPLTSKIWAISIMFIDLMGFGRGSTIKTVLVLILLDLVAFNSIAAKQKIKMFKRWVMLLLIVFVMVIGRNIYSQIGLRTSGTGAVSTVYSEATDNNSIQLFNKLPLPEGGGIRFLTRVIALEEMGIKRPVKHILFALNPLPSFLSYDDDASNWFAKITGTYGSYGVPLPLLPELYSLFSWFSLFIFIILGFLGNRLWRNMFTAIHQQASAYPFKYIFIYFVFLVSIWQCMAHDPLRPMLRLLLNGALLIWVIYKIAHKRIIKL
jgi:hypothetical protein